MSQLLHRDAMPVLRWTPMSMSSLVPDLHRGAPGSGRRTFRMPAAIKADACEFSDVPVATVLGHQRAASDAENTGSDTDGCRWSAPGVHDGTAHRGGKKRRGTQSTEAAWWGGPREFGNSPVFRTNTVPYGHSQERAHRSPPGPLGQCAGFGACEIRRPGGW